MPLIFKITDHINAPKLQNKTVDVEKWIQDYASGSPYFCGILFGGRGAPCPLGFHRAPRNGNPPPEGVRGGPPGWLRSPVKEEGGAPGS